MAKDTELKWEDAIRQVLAEAATSLHYTEVSDRIVRAKLKKKIGATPSATVAACLSKIVSTPGSDIQKTGRGLFALKSALEAAAVEPEAASDAPEDSESGAIQAFGMYWKYDDVHWTGKVRLLGRQNQEAATVDFSEQVGIYLLHDRDRVIYVGRASETLASRLKAHTTDRLSGRWDRFSWFGLRSVTEDAKLAEPPASWKHHDVIDTMEAVLIECLEPSKNRRGGDRFADVEFLQVLAPEIQSRQQKQLLTQLAQKLDN